MYATTTSTITTQGRRDRGGCWRHLMLYLFFLARQRYLRLESFHPFKFSTNVKRNLQKTEKKKKQHFISQTNLRNIPRNILVKKLIRVNLWLVDTS